MQRKNTSIYASGHRDGSSVIHRIHQDILLDDSILGIGCERVKPSIMPLRNILNHRNTWNPWKWCFSSSSTPLPIQPLDPNQMLLGSSCIDGSTIHHHHSTPSSSLSLEQASLFLSLSVIPMCCTTLHGEILHTNSYFDIFRGNAMNIFQMISIEDIKKFNINFNELRTAYNKMHDVYKTKAYSGTQNEEISSYTWGLQTLPGLNYILISCIQTPNEYDIDIPIHRNLSHQSESSSVSVHSITDKHLSISRKPWLKFINKIEKSTRKALELQETQLKITAMCELLETKRTFVRYVSHEIRTPLNVVLTGLELLERLNLPCSNLNTSSSLIQTSTCGTIIESSTSESGVVLSPSNYSAPLNSNNAPSNYSAPTLNSNSELIIDAKYACTVAIDILNDFLTYEKLDSNILILDIQNCNILNILKKTIAMFSIQAFNSNIKLQFTSNLLYNEHCTLQGDANKLSQVFRNVLSNALKFSIKNGIVHVCITKLTQHNTQYIQKDENEHIFKHMTDHIDEQHIMNDVVRITVQDSGPGMSLANRQRLFNEVVQFDAATLQNGQGSGLGLYLTKGIVKLHGGSIGVDMDWEGPGSVFYIELPVTTTTTIVPNIDETLIHSSTLETNTISMRNEAPVVSLRLLTVLIVDDVVLCRKLHRRIFTPFCSLIIEAVNGQEAIDVVTDSMDKHITIDVIVMDSSMPIMDGPCATSVIRQLGYTGTIIGVTGNAFQSDIDDFLSHGANQVLVKPVPLATFEDIIASIL